MPTNPMDLAKLEVRRVERFWRRVEKGDGTGCWLWTGCVDDCGYGVLWVRREGKDRNEKAHRYSWELANGPIPAGKWVLHSCDNPPCVRPDHLYLGDHQRNMDDMYARGRGRKAVGEQHHGAKLTEADVREIRRLYVPRSFVNGTSALARRYGVAQGVVWSIVKRRTWRHVA
jgi:HNH endonuclease